MPEFRWDGRRVDVFQVLGTSDIQIIVHAWMDNHVVRMNIAVNRIAFVVEHGNITGYSVKILILLIGGLLLHDFVM